MKKTYQHHILARHVSEAGNPILRYKLSWEGAWKPFSGGSWQLGLCSSRNENVFANPLVAQFMTHLYSIETTGDQSVAIALMLRDLGQCVHEHLLEKKKIIQGCVVCLCHGPTGKLEGKREIGGQLTFF